MISQPVPVTSWGLGPWGSGVFPGAAAPGPSESIAGVYLSAGSHLPSHASPQGKVTQGEEGYWGLTGATESSKTG